MKALERGLWGVCMHANWDSCVLFLVVLRRWQILSNPNTLRTLNMDFISFCPHCSKLLYTNNNTV